MIDKRQMFLFRLAKNLAKMDEDAMQDAIAHISEGERPLLLATVKAFRSKA